MTEQDLTQLIEADRRLSQSIIWDIQRRYFLQNGMRAWQDDVVPHTISSNPVMARAYSQVAFNYVRDCVTAVNNNTFSLNSEQPIYIVELGAGSGRLAYHFLHQFHDRLAQSSLAELPIKFVMTDFVPEIVDFWQEHDHFKPWVEAGLLDFALFDVGDKRPLTLRHAHLTLTPDLLQNPLILIANYFFDSIPQDSFVIEDGQLCENLLTLYSSQPEPDLSDPTIWDRLELAYEAIPLMKPYYDVPEYNQILDEYESQLPDAAISFPNVGLDCVRFWQGFGNACVEPGRNGRILLLSSDRGYTLPHDLIGQENPLPNLHGSFSLMVNYHAIGQFVEQSGGLALHPEHYQENIQVAAYLLGQLPQQGLETQQSFAEAIAMNGPNEFFAIKQALAPHLESLTLAQLLSYLRLSAWDADVFRDCFPTLLAHVQGESPVWYADVANAITHIQQQYLPLDETDDFEEMIRKLFEEMGIEENFLEAE
ncbi:MAG: hypothetical protein DWQ04_14590 [Chloroflexi bacterium]|nr:MAG: hypothetical protein DWQ04_14590 [Chloroflexota bacterium]